MQKVKLAASLLLFAALLIIVLQNMRPVPMRLLFVPVELPLAVLVGVTTLFGFLLGLLAALLIVGRRRQLPDDSGGVGRG